jgi:hypothetical protein
MRGLSTPLRCSLKTIGQYAISLRPIVSVVETLTRLLGSLRFPWEMLPHQIKIRLVHFSRNAGQRNTGRAHRGDLT